MKYSKNGTCNTIDEYIYTQTGKHINELDSYKNIYNVDKLDVAAITIIRAMSENKKIFVYGDYDADGITSLYEMSMIFDAYGFKNYRVFAPRRFTDGYGVNSNVVAQLNADMLITIDNGITAVKPIAEAKAKGMEVVILDHHLAGKIIPEADVIVDPEAFPESSDFSGFCGAGIIYELSKLMLPSRKDITDKIMTIASIGTVADVVPLLDANRQIVQNGLANICSPDLPLGIKSLISALGYNSKITAKDIAFGIAPAINSPGRLLDCGANSVVSLLRCTDPFKIDTWTQDIVEINESRKETVKNAMENITIDDHDTINFIKGDYPAGIIGLIAGKLTEATNKPSFVLSSASNGIRKGSARSNSADNSIIEILKSVSDKLVGFGGHAGAAGFSVMDKDFDEVHKRISSYPIIQNRKVNTYDLDLDVSDMYGFAQIIDQMNLAEPFGCGIREPLFRVKCHVGPGQYHSMGSDSSHLRLDIENGIRAVCFGMMQRYEDEGMPSDLYLYGTPKWNVYKGKSYPQFMVSDYEKAE
jgi:single-stranded-DNA-specific exonuclease